MPRRLGRGFPASELSFRRVATASLVVVAFSLLLFGCGGGGGGDNPADGLPDDGGYHPAGWATNPQHGTDFNSNPQNCLACHGNDLTGGSSGVPCLACHHGVSGPYPGHTGTASHNDPGGCDGCHGEDFDGAVFAALVVPSCFECHEEGDDGSGREIMNPDRDPGVPDTGVCAKTSCHPDLQSHPTHTAPPGDSPLDRGPSSRLACEDCHAQNPFIYATYADGRTSSSTTVCDYCHSPNGAFDGVSDTTVGAKFNWSGGVYTAGALQSGKEEWCAGCHDNVAANSQVDGSGVTAPNVIGNNSTYGFYVTGHNIDCLECHDATKTHIDDEHRTYASGMDNYVTGYRLKDVGGQPAMNIPRPLYAAGTNPLDNAGDFALCFECHDQFEVLNADGDLTIVSNFWNDDLTPQNSHNFHLGTYTTHFDSDWDGTADSSESCIACHNVHGAPNQAMVRHGELISTPGTTDKVPSLNFAYLSAPDTRDTSLSLAASIGGSMDYAGFDIAQNGVCNACHNAISYQRDPYLGP